MDLVGLKVFGRHNRLEAQHIPTLEAGGELNLRGWKLQFLPNRVNQFVEVQFDFHYGVAPV